MAKPLPDKFEYDKYADVDIPEDIQKFVKDFTEDWDDSWWITPIIEQMMLAERNRYVEQEEKSDGTT